KTCLPRALKLADQVGMFPARLFARCPDSEDEGKPCHRPPFHRQIIDSQSEAGCPRLELHRRVTDYQGGIASLEHIGTVRCSNRRTLAECRGGPVAPSEEYPNEGLRGPRRAVQNYRVDLLQWSPASQNDTFDAFFRGHRDAGHHS